MATESITFTGANGDQLSARLELPASGRPRATAVFAHCFTCSKNVKAAVNVTRALAREGYAVLRFDFTGLGESQGDFADTNFSSNVADVVAAAEHLGTEIAPPSLLVGHSLGGAAVLLAAAQLPTVKAVATIGAPADPEHVLHHVSSSIEEIERDGEATVSIAGRPFRVKKQFLDDLESRNMAEIVGGLRRAVMIFHSPIDEIVGIENAARIYEMAKHPKSFVSLDQANHLLTDPADASYVGSVLSAWAGRFIEEEEIEDETAALRDAERAVTRTGAEGFFTDVVIRQHTMAADEPTSVGGEDLGPTPYEYLLGGLGACTSMTLQMYARRKGWPLDEARVRLKHRRVHASDCEECDAGGNPRLDVIDREVELIGDLDDDQRARMMEIADRCPVHRTLEAGVRVETTERRE